MRQVIRLNERELHTLINESVKRIINESKFRLVGTRKGRVGNDGNGRIGGVYGGSTIEGDFYLCEIMNSDGFADELSSQLSSKYNCDQTKLGDVIYDIMENTSVHAVLSSGYDYSVGDSGSEDIDYSINKEEFRNACVRNRVSGNLMNDIFNSFDEYIQNAYENGDLTDITSVGYPEEM